MRRHDNSRTQLQRNGGGNDAARTYRIRLRTDRTRAGSANTTRPTRSLGRSRVDPAPIVRISAGSMSRPTLSTWRKKLLLRSRLRRLRRQGQRLRLLLLLYYNQVLGLPEAWSASRSWSPSSPTPVSIRSSATSPITSTRAGDAATPSCTPRPAVGVAYYCSGTRRPASRATRCSRTSSSSPSLLRALIALYEIPSASLVAELTDHYDERTVDPRATASSSAGGAGSAWRCSPTRCSSQPDAEHPVGVLNPTATGTTGWPRRSS